LIQPGHRFAKFIVVAAVTLGAASAQAQKHTKATEGAATLPPAIWRDPGNPSALNLFYGSGGPADAPDPNANYTFLKEDLKGTSPKFDVRDDRGVEWRVKLGQEPQSETAAAHLLWGAGYFTDEDYFLPELKVNGLPRLHRGRKFVSPDGVVHRARLKRRSKDGKKLGEWDWFENTFAKTKELNGLRVMMALMNNWDLNDDNNSIEVVDGERRYVVSDLGATFGRTGNNLKRSKSKLKDYVQSPFIESSSPETVDFVMHTRPTWLLRWRFRLYRERVQFERITRNIPRSDAKWVGQRLALLSEDQIRDCFRSAGYDDHEVEGYTKAVQKRIAELNAL
jgi:hypothetical protein